MSYYRRRWGDKPVLTRAWGLRQVGGGLHPRCLVLLYRFCRGPFRWPFVLLFQVGCLGMLGREHPRRGWRHGVGVGVWVEQWTKVWRCRKVYLDYLAWAHHTCHSASSICRSWVSQTRRLRNSRLLLCRIRASVCKGSLGSSTPPATTPGVGATKLLDETAAP